MPQEVQLEIGGHTVAITPNSHGGFDFTKKRSTGDARFLEMNDGGGHLSLQKPGSLPSDVGLEIDENGRAIFHDA